MRVAVLGDSITEGVPGVSYVIYYQKNFHIMNLLTMVKVETPY